MNGKKRMALLVSTLGAASATLAAALPAQAAAARQAETKAQVERSQSAVPDLARVVSTMNITAIPN